MGRKIIPEADLEQIWEMIKSEIPVSLILEQFNVSRSFVYKLKHEYEAEYDTHTVVFSHDKGNKYCYDEAFDCAYYSGRKCQKCDDTRFTDEFGYREICPFYTERLEKVQGKESRNDEIISLYEGGMIYKDIAEKMELPYSTVYGVVQQAQKKEIIKKRKKGKPKGCQTKR